MNFLRIVSYAAVISTVSALSLNLAFAQDTPEDNTAEVVPDVNDTTAETAAAAPETVAIPDCSDILFAIDTEDAGEIDRTTEICVARLGAPGLTQAQIDEVVLSLVEEMINRDVPVELRTAIVDAIRLLSAVTSPDVTDGLTQIAASYEEGDETDVAATDQAASPQ